MNNEKMSQEPHEEQTPDEMPEFQEMQLPPRPLYGGAALEVTKNMPHVEGKFVDVPTRQYSEEQLEAPVYPVGAKAVLSRAMKRDSFGRFVQIVPGWQEKTKPTFENAEREKQGQLATRLGGGAKDAMTLRQLRKELLALKEAEVAQQNVEEVIEESDERKLSA